MAKVPLPGEARPSVIDELDAALKRMESEKPSVVDELNNALNRGPATSESVSEAVYQANLLHAKESIRKHGENFLRARAALNQSSDEDVISRAILAAQKREAPTADDYAAINKHRAMMMTATGYQTPQAKVTGGALKLASGLGTVLDVSHRAAWRAPGWWLATGMSWSDAWKTSKAGWSDDLMAAGAPWWAAYGVGLPLEAATDPMTVLGLGVGLKGVAAPGDELAELALKHGVKGVKGVKHRIGIFMRNRLGKRVLRGIPKTEPLGNLLARAFQSPLFTRAADPAAGILRVLYKGLAEDDAAKAAFAMKSAWRPFGDQIAQLKLEPEAFQRAWFAAEYMNHYQKGELWAKQAVEDITGGNVKEIDAARFIRSGFDEVGGVIQKLDLNYPSMLRPMDKRIAGIRGELAAIEKRARRVSSGARAATKKATAAEKMVTQLGETAQEKVEKLGEFISERKAVMESQVEKTVGRAVREVQDAPRTPKFVQPQRAKDAGAKTVTVDLEKLDEAWKAGEPGFYVGKGGEGPSAVGGRYEGFGQWMSENPGKAIEMPEIGLTEAGTPTFKNGRHRFAWLRDQGHKTIQVAVDPENAKALKQQFGAKAAQLKPAKVVARRAADIAEAQTKALKGKAYAETLEEGFTPEYLRQTAAAEEAYLGVKPKEMLAKPYIPSTLEELKMRVRPGTASALTEAKKMEDVAESLGKTVERLRDMHPEELQRELKKALPFKQLRGLSPIQYGKSERLLGDLEEVYKAQAAFSRRAKKLREVADKKVTKAQAFKDMKRYQKLMDEARRIDVERAKTPGYVPRVTSAERKKAVAAADREYQYFPKPFSRSGAGKQRKWLTKEGRPMYEWELEQEFRKFVDNPATMLESGKARRAAEKATQAAQKTQYYDLMTKADAAKKAGDLKLAKTLRAQARKAPDVAEYKKLWGEAKRGLKKAASTDERAAYMQKTLMEMFGEKDVAKALEKARQHLGEGQFLMSRVFETDPALAVPMSMNRVMQDTKSKSMLQGLRMVASDVPGPGMISSASFGGDVASMYRDKYFPAEMLTEYKEWTARIAKSMSDVTLPMRMYDASHGFWKMMATSPLPGLWPSFKFRNAFSDLIRAASEGPYNPVGVYIDGTKAVFRGKGAIKLGELGSVTGAELWDLAESYRVTGGFWEEMTAPISRWKRGLRYLGMGEDVRRVGYFADRIKHGLTPQAAAEATRRVFFDYQNLAPWERTYARRVIPFWTWARNNFSFQVQKLFSQPYWTAAQMRVLRTRDRLSEQEELDWFPRGLRGNMGIVLNENGVTSLLYGVGLDTGDIVSVLDATGHPKGALKGMTDEFRDRITPLLQGPLDSLEDFMTGEGETLIAAPRGAENLPSGIRDFFGIKKSRKKIGAYAAREVWEMPRGSRRLMESLRVFSEVMRFFRYDHNKTLNENRLSQAVSFLTGLSKRQISETQIEEMIMRDRMEHLQKAVLDKGWLRQSGGLTPEGARTKLGREYMRTYKRYILSYKRRVIEEEKKRTSWRRKYGKEEQR